MAERKRILKSTEILLWVYGVGLAGMLLPFTREIFKIITPLNLLFAVVFLFYRKIPARIFGAYTYGKTLGPALFNTPVIIGLNWFLLIYCTNVISRQLLGILPQKVTGRMASLVRSGFVIITGSLLMVLYDLILEPAAIRLDMWSWDGSGIPVQNYLAWFIFSAAFHTLVRLWGEEEINPRALPLFVVQLIFFAVIDLFYVVLA